MKTDPRVVFHIVTQRYGLAHPMSEASDVYEMAKRIGIKPENVHFTNRADKWPIVKSLNSVMHIDDDFDQLALIQINCPGCLTISSI
jgi:hypothetical protein